MKVQNTIISSFIFCVQCSWNANAQLCNGSLGDPVVNITFGTSANPDNSNYVPPGAYIFTSSTCPNDGNYTVTSSSPACFGSTWHSISTDHTGNGNFMLVNASYNPGDFFVTTVNGLCPNTTYEFAAWIMNVLVPFGIRPNVTFRIEKPDGTILGQYNTGDIPENSQPIWRQYGFFFTTPLTDASIVLRITNNAPGGIGNDLALDDITFRPCGGSIDVSITGMNDTLDFCEGNTSIYTINAAVSSTYQQPFYQWQVSLDSGKSWTDIPGANSNSYTRQPTGSGRYMYRLTVTESASAGVKACRIASNNIVFNVHAKPFVNAGPDRFVIAGDSITLNANVTGENPIYTWSPPDYLSNTSELNPKASPPADITYSLSASSSFGCINSDNVTIKVIGGIYIPTGFTPNGDGKNDTWRIPYLDPDWEALVSVYNRYGQIIYSSKGTSISWDGTFKGIQQKADTYIYVFKIPSKNLTLKGTVTLIR